MIKTRTWVLVILAIFALCALSGVFIRLGSGSASIANIYQSGDCLYSIDLSKVDDPYELVIQGASGSNTVRVERGRICIIRADCPNQDCVRSGWISNGATPIVCLPNELVIRLEKSAASNPDGIDAVAR